jgi:acyl-CoA synthetase (AMP-forming)/AMP-acid ligase II
VHAFVVTQDNAVTAAELKAFCAARLTDYQVPESFTLSQTLLPRNANGKLLKRELRVVSGESS